MLGWHPGAAGEEEKSQFLVSPPSWVPWSPSEHTFSDCFIPPAAVATPAFPISPHHLSSASTCLLTLCGGCLWNTTPPGGHLDFSPHCCSTLVLPVMQETWVPSLSQEDPLEKETATHSSILAWRIPWTEEPGRLQSMGSPRVRHD